MKCLIWLIKSKKFWVWSDNVDSNDFSILPGYYFFETRSPKNDDGDIPNVDVCADGTGAATLDDEA